LRKPTLLRQPARALRQRHPRHEADELQDDEGNDAAVEVRPDDRGGTVPFMKADLDPVEEEPRG
jgi:hypothetical protein